MVNSGFAPIHADLIVLTLFEERRASQADSGNANSDSRQANSGNGSMPTKSKFVNAKDDSPKVIPCDASSTNSHR